MSLKVISVEVISVEFMMDDATSQISKFLISWKSF